jgi:hypothetical protein
MDLSVNEVLARMLGGFDVSGRERPTAVAGERVLKLDVSPWPYIRPSLRSFG